MSFQDEDGCVTVKGVCEGVGRLLWWEQEGSTQMVLTAFVEEARFSISSWVTHTFPEDCSEDEKDVRTHTCTRSDTHAHTQTECGVMERESVLQAGSVFLHLTQICGLFLRATFRKQQRANKTLAGKRPLVVLRQVTSGGKDKVWAMNLVNCAQFRAWYFTTVSDVCEWQKKKLRRWRTLSIDVKIKA